MAAKKIDNFCCSLEQSPACVNCSTRCQNYGKCTMCLCYGDTCLICKFNIKEDGDRKSQR